MWTFNNVPKAEIKRRRLGVVGRKLKRQLVAMLVAADQGITFRLLDLPPELRLNVYTHALSTVARCGCGTNTDSAGTIQTGYRIEITAKTKNHNLTKIMEVFQFLFYLWLLFTDVAIAVANITVANLSLSRSMSHLLIPSNAVCITDYPSAYPQWHTRKG